MPNQSVLIQRQNVRFDSATNGSITDSFKLWSAVGEVACARLSADIRSMTRTDGALRLPTAQRRFASVAELLSVKH